MNYDPTDFLLFSFKGGDKDSSFMNPFNQVFLNIDYVSSCWD